nr:endogenous retrovirus group K member 8 Gag polyprotein-like [Cavia porcellus]
MGNLPTKSSKSLVRAMKDLLKISGISISSKTLTEFLQQIDEAAPWFLPTGHLSLPCWEKLGKDLERAEAECRLPLLVRPLWEMIHSCLKGERNGAKDSADGLSRARRVFEEARSESSREGSVAGSMRGRSRERGRRETPPASDSSDSDTSEGEDNEVSDSPNPFTALRRDLVKMQTDLKRGKELLNTPQRKVIEPSAPPWGVPNTGPYNEMTAWGPPPLPPPQREWPGPLSHKEPPSYLPDGPPSCAPGAGQPFCKETPFCDGGSQPFHRETPSYNDTQKPLGKYFRRWTVKMEQIPYGTIGHDQYGFYPVHLAQGQGPNYWEPLEIKQIKELKTAVATFGPTAPYTITMLENLSAGGFLTPSDWTQLAKACLAPGAFLDWRAWYTEFAAEQAERNAARGHRGQNEDMLMGKGQYAQDQTRFPPGVYEQIHNIGIRAWKQGNAEPFVDFVARMQEAADRLFSDPIAAAPLVKQLIFEQCTKDCRAAIAPHKGKDIEAWIKICREIGGPLSNSGVAALLAAALRQTRPQKANDPGKPRGCFQCGDPNHIRKNCPKTGRGEFIPRRQESDKQTRTCERVSPAKIIEHYPEAVASLALEAHNRAIQHFGSAPHAIREPGREPLWVPERLTRVANPTERNAGDTPKLNGNEQPGQDRSNQDTAARPSDTV